MIIRRWLGGFVPLLVVTVLGFQVGAVGVQASPLDTEPDGTDVGAGEPVVDPGVLDQGERDLVAELGLADPPDQSDAPDRRVDASRVERVSEMLQFRSEGLRRG